MIRSADPPPAGPLGEPYLTPAQVAEHFAVSRNRVAGWIARGELAAVNTSVEPTGRRPRYRIHPEAVAAFAAARGVQPPAPRRRRRPRYRRIV